MSAQILRLSVRLDKGKLSRQHISPRNAYPPTRFNKTMCSASLDRKFDMFAIHSLNPKDSLIISPPEFCVRCKL